MTDPTSRRVPMPALVLGLAGLLPLIPAIVAEGLLRPAAGGHESMVLVVAVPALGYAAVILSFLGGMWWGLASAGRGDRASWGLLVMAVVPSLAACAAFVTGGLAGPPLGTAAVLAAGLLLSLLGDLGLVRAGLAPPWWMRLRVPLSCGLALETIAVAALA